MCDLKGGITFMCKPGLELRDFSSVYFGARWSLKEWVQLVAEAALLTVNSWRPERDMDRSGLEEVVNKISSEWGGEGLI